MSEELRDQDPTPKEGGENCEENNESADMENDGNENQE
jgi:hypothetical protein